MKYLFLIPNIIRFQITPKKLIFRLIGIYIYYFSAIPQIVRLPCSAFLISQRTIKKSVTLLKTLPRPRSLLQLFQFTFELFSPHRFNAHHPSFSNLHWHKNTHPLFYVAVTFSSWNRSNRYRSLMSCIMVHLFARELSASGRKQQDWCISSDRRKNLWQWDQRKK